METTNFGSEPLLVSPTGAILDLEHGYIPLLTDFTFEDKAAKGLRKRTEHDKPEPSVYFSALEVVRDHRVLFLTGPSGSGKTTFAKHLCFSLGTSAQISRRVVRNELGFVHEEAWDATVVPYYFAIHTPQALKDLVEITIPELSRNEEQILIVLDAIEKAEDDASDLLASLISLIEGLDHIRLLVLSDITPRPWTLPPGIVRHNLLPLLQIQRTKVTEASTFIGTGAAAANPAIFALALQARHSGDQAEQVLDVWLGALSTDSAADNLARDAFERLISNTPTPPSPQDTATDLLLSSVSTVQQLLAARHLTTLPTNTAIQFFQSNPQTAEPVIRSLLSRLSPSNLQTLAADLIHGSGELAQRGALLVSSSSSSTFLPKIETIPHLKPQISTHMLSIITTATLPIPSRTKAAAILSRLGDPRDLTSLATIPAGPFTFGSNNTNYPTSNPESTLTLKSFKIGIYPVINRDYALFIHETGCEWLSPHALHPEKQTLPATDLTWYDARAYCEWLTGKWRASNKISKTEFVRLPSEPEWERAATTSNPNPPTTNTTTTTIGDNQYINYPWGSHWHPNASNTEETGLNTPCAVGLFPSGISPSGCHDMAGQVWEWCTTLWGEDMGTPRFRYPYREDDGREDLDAGGSVRRVLRGGCFSSGRRKVSVWYRGSLEPGGKWRGNGFRVVVDDDDDDDDDLLSLHFKG